MNFTDSSLLVFQTTGGAFAVSAAQSAFVNVLISILPSTAPNVNPITVITTGATEIRTAFKSEDVPGVVLAYMKGVKATFAIATGAAGISLLLTMFANWKRLHGGALKEIGGIA
jgi:hypothetical protein